MRVMIGERGSVTNLLMMVRVYIVGLLTEIGRYLRWVSTLGRDEVGIRDSKLY